MRRLLAPFATRHRGAPSPRRTGRRAAAAAAASTSRRAASVERALACAAFAALAALALLAFPPAARAVGSFTGRCVGVLDGDSIEVLALGKLHEIRLEGIDAPERGQPFASRAKQVLSDRIFQKEVRVDGKTTDQYGRLVARVFVGDLDTSLDMLRQGLAWHYKRYSSEEALANAESVARARKVGLWADPGASPPWSYRRPAAGLPLPAGRAAPPGSAAERAPASSPVAAGEVHGNTGSRVFHRSTCGNFQCRYCTARFPSAAAAEAAGYRPAGCCHPTRR